MDAAALLDSTPHAVLVLDETGGITYANASACALTGLRKSDAIGSAMLDLVGERHRARAGRLLTALLAGAHGGPVRFQLAGPRERWVAVRAAPLPSGGAQLAVVEITDAALAEQRVRRSESRFRSAFEVSPTATAIVDDQGRFLRVNAALAELTGRPIDWFPGRTADEVTLPDDLPTNSDVSRRLRQGETPVRLAKRYRRPDGVVRYGLLTAVKVLGNGGESLTIAQIEDVTEQREAEQQLHRLALHDALTDLPGRHLLLERLEEALEGAGRVAVLFVDLDGFKLVNDALGHSVGDAVLVEVAGRLLASVRPGDAVGRLGGDEFLVLCRDLVCPEQAVEVAHAIERALARPFPDGDDEILISASVGVAYATATSTAADLVRDSDAAMYRAKQLGKRRYEVFDEGMRARAAERSRLERLLRGGALQERLEVHYQPIVRLATGVVVAVEALARLRDDDGALLLPSSFLDVAKDAGLLGTLDDAVRLRATSDVMMLRAALDADLHLSVNLSAARLTADLPARVAQDLALSGLPPSRLSLEITEQTLVDRGPASELALQALSVSGVRLAIDDFGTGWASLTYLRRFPVDAVKIDRSFVAGLNDARQDQVIVRAVVDLARQLRLSCTAEGVETTEQAEALMALGTPHGQGLLFGGAVPVADLLADLATRALRRPHART